MTQPKDSASCSCSLPGCLIQILLILAVIYMWKLVF